MNNEELKSRTKEFAHRCVKLALSLPKTELGKHISGQLIRCSTSVAANYRAALMAQTKPAFISKISIVKVLPLFTEAHELSSIFIITRRTAQKKG